MKFRADNHIIGKVYELTQENMNALIKTVEDLQEENARFRAALERIAYPDKCKKCDYQIKLTECLHGKKEYEIARISLEEKE